MDYSIGKEYVPFGTYVPDLDAISRNQVAIVTAAGSRSGDAYYARTARLLAQRLGCPYVEFPGNHFAYRTDTAAFASVLRKVLQGLKLERVSRPELS